MILDDNNPQYVAACIDKMVKDKKLRDYVIEEQNERLEYYSMIIYLQCSRSICQSLLIRRIEHYEENWICSSMVS